MLLLFIGLPIDFIRFYVCLFENLWVLLDFTFIYWTTSVLLEFTLVYWKTYRFY